MKPSGIFTTAVDGGPIKRIPVGDFVTYPLVVKFFKRHAVIAAKGIHQPDILGENQGWFHDLDNFRDLLIQFTFEFAQYLLSEIYSIDRVDAVLLRDRETLHEAVVDGRIKLKRGVQILDVELFVNQ